jgi:hypothetical protein
VTVVLKDDLLDAMQAIATERGTTIVQTALRLIEEGVERRGRC